MRLNGALYQLYDTEPLMARIEGMLDELESRADGGPHPAVFGPRPG